MRGGRNNLLAGALVMCSIIAALIVVILLAGGIEALGKHPYRVRFSVTDGATGLEQGSRILVGGQPVGVVDSLEFAFGSDGNPDFVEALIRVDRRIKFKRGAIAYLISPILGGSGTINFRSSGEGDPLTMNDFIEGRIAPPTILAQAGYGEDQARQVQNFIRNISDASEKANAVLDDAKNVTGDFRGKWPAWSDRIDSITKNTDETMAKGPAIADSLQERLDRLREIVQIAREYLEENRQNVKDGIASFRSIGSEGEKFMGRLNGELTEKAVAFLDEGRRALNDGEKAVETVQGLLNEQTPNIRRGMANFRLASDQLAATLSEVRRSPWRLLYRPDKRELNFELLYDSARTYAAAVSDLRATSETLRVLAESSASQPDPARTADVVQELERSFDRYKQAEAEFLRQVMLEAEPGLVP